MNPALAPEMPFARLARAYLTESKYEAVRMLRTIAFVLPLMVLPVVIYVMFGMLMAHDAVNAHPSIGNLLFVGYTVFAVMGPALFSIGVTLAIERDAGLLKLKRALPAPPGAYLLSKMVTAVFFAMLAMAVMMATALLGGHMTLSFGQLAAVAAVMAVGVLPFCALGLFIGAHVSGSAAPAVANLVFLPMTWFSGLFFPPPAFLKSFVAIWPAFHLEQLALAAAGLQEFRQIAPLISFAVLAAFTAVFGGLAMRRLARNG
jgi:ABC-2 type transport system permease protein